MTQLESDVFTNIDTSGYNPTATSAGGEIGLLGHAVLGYDPTTYSLTLIRVVTILQLLQLVERLAYWDMRFLVMTLPILMLFKHN